MKKAIQLFTFLFLTSLLVVSCKKDDKKQEMNGGAFFEELNQNLSAAVVRDQFSPPVASRIYAYSFIAAYEAAVPFYPEYKSLVGRINGMKEMPKPANVGELYPEICVLTAFAFIGKDMTYKNHVLTEYEKTKLAELSKGRDEERVEKSVEYGKQVAAGIKKWMKEDNYVAIKKSAQYKQRDSRQHWVKTFPDYIDATEPNWMTLRPIALDSSSQCRTSQCTPFDSTKGSAFYEENMQVYNVVNDVLADRDTTKKFIAYFWDDNPNVSSHHGHMTFQELKLTPGGHWLGITSATSRQKKQSLIEAAEAHMLVSAALFDGFLACWDEKFVVECIRPITYINRWIDPEWKPFLQTPPFPEYPSGHSVVSAAAATVLTNIYGDNHKFTDSTEMDYLHGIRSFNSFNEAAEEASMSRMYGGIHYMPAIKQGMAMGREVGNNVLDKLKKK